MLFRSLLVLASLAGVIGWLRFRVEYDWNGLQVRSMTVANRRCAYRDLWGIEGKKRLFLDKGSVRLSRGNAWDELVSTAQRGYQRAHGGKRIPRVYSIRRSRDPFNGNVLQPGEVIFVYSNRPSSVRTSRLSPRRLTLNPASFRLIISSRSF